jgi:hypothetical protein
MSCTDFFESKEALETGTMKELMIGVRASGGGGPVPLSPIHGFKSPSLFKSPSTGTRSHHPRIVLVPEVTYLEESVDHEREQERESRQEKERKEKLLQCAVGIASSLGTTFQKSGYVVTLSLS